MNRKKRESAPTDSPQSSSDNASAAMHSSLLYTRTEVQVCQALLAKKIKKRAKKFQLTEVNLDEFDPEDPEGLMAEEDWMERVGRFHEGEVS
jgi:hypothetical protein